MKRTIPGTGGGVAITLPLVEQLPRLNYHGRAGHSYVLGLAVAFRTGLLCRFLEIFAAAGVPAQLAVGLRMLLLVC